LVVTGQRILDAEFPAQLQASSVLRAIGSGERSFAKLSARSGAKGTTLSRSLDLLRQKRVVAVDQPTSLRTANEPRYRVADPYLRYWLRFVEPAVGDIARGRPDVALARVRESWTAFRGRAIEPLVREALARLAAGDPRLGGAGHVGGWWPRHKDPEVELVGVDREKGPRKVCFVGSVKWREGAPFDADDLAKLESDRSAVPGGAGAPLVAVSRAGCTAHGVTWYGPSHLLAAWA
ncbi:MAG: DUF234 domain-containing protein, partial [Acidimicrobiales bacterium]